MHWSAWSVRIQPSLRKLETVGNLNVTANPNPIPQRGMTMHAVLYQWQFHVGSGAPVSQYCPSESRASCGICPGGPWSISWCFGCMAYRCGMCLGPRFTRPCYKMPYIGYKLCCNVVLRAGKIEFSLIQGVIKLVCFGFCYF